MAETQETAVPPTEAAPATPQPATDAASPAAEVPPAAAPPATAPPADIRTADLTAGPGGVMTDEVGVVTGDLTLRTELSGGQVTLRVQYKDAAEWYVVTGGRAALKDPADLDAVHTIALALLHRPEG